MWYFNYKVSKALLIYHITEIVLPHDLGVSLFCLRSSIKVGENGIEFFMKLIQNYPNLSSSLECSGEVITSMHLEWSYVVLAASLFSLRRSIKVGEKWYWIFMKLVQKLSSSLECSGEVLTSMHLGWPRKAIGYYFKKAIIVISLLKCRTMVYGKLECQYATFVPTCNIIIIAYL